MALTLEPYLQQLARWPSSGRGILAQHDRESVVVYQAYAPTIGHFAARHGHFGGDFSLSRMSWVKPNFLWMMYRSGWATKADQEVVLAIRMRREAFDELLRLAVPSSWSSAVHPTREAWAQAVAGSEVRSQWDPDHDPVGKPVERRALQLGLRGSVLRQYAREWLLGIEDVSSLVETQRGPALERRWEALQLPRETPYPVEDAVARGSLGLDW